MRLDDVLPKAEDDDEWSAERGKDSTTDDDDSCIDQDEKSWNVEERQRKSEKRAVARHRFSTGTYTQVFGEM